jgi:hypothetical protein
MPHFHCKSTLETSILVLSSATRFNVFRHQENTPPPWDCRQSATVKTKFDAPAQDPTRNPNNRPVSQTLGYRAGPCTQTRGQGSHPQRFHDSCSQPLRGGDIEGQSDDGQGPRSRGVPQPEPRWGSRYDIFANVEERLGSSALANAPVPRPRQQAIGII